ncbi:hypothetical protein GCM10027422_08490 [Hymenobacter arcticus]
MKNNYLRWLGLLCGAALAGPVAAQTTPADTTHLRYGEEAAAPATAPLPQRVQRVAQGQWKLGLNNFLVDAYPALSIPALGSYNLYYTRYGLHLAYERRLGRAWSGQVEVSPAITHYRLAPGQDISAGLSVRAQLAGRYYYNLERRLRRGHYTGNFSANYVSLAVGTGLGGPVRETPFYLVASPVGAVADAALLYGLQRRLGSYGFVDASLGISALLAGGSVQSLGLNGSLRLGLVLPGAGPAVAPPVPADAVLTLLPRAYVGVQVGGYSYRLHYSPDNPLPPSAIIPPPNVTVTTSYGSGAYNNGYGTYTQYVSTLPYVYGGYYLTPRLAVQAGVQYERYHKVLGAIAFDTPSGYILVQNLLATDQQLAVPVSLRYALTPAFQQRFQFEVIGSLVPLWSSSGAVQYEVVNQQLTSQVAAEFERRLFSMHASLGVGVSYGFGYRRRVQATAEFLTTKDLSTTFNNTEPLQGGVSAGLRYRFGYH